MMREPFRCRRGAALACVALLAVAAGPAGGAQIVERTGPFELCIESRYEKWVNARAELVVNEDPKAGDIDDAAVAKWTIETLNACRAQAGGGDQASETRFTKHMARWREHIYELARSIRERAGTD